MNMTSNLVKVGENLSQNQTNEKKSSSSVRASAQTPPKKDEAGQIPNVQP